MFFGKSPISLCFDGKDYKIASDSIYAFGDPLMLLTLLAAASMSAPVDDLLPDIIIWDRYLASAYVGSTNSAEPPSGRRCLRFSTTTANIGTGTLELRGGSPSGDLQPVFQRIFRSDNTWFDRLAGNFTYHPAHGHMHFDNWTQFKLRQVTAGNGVGDVVAVGAKQSFCIIETTVYDSTMPGFNNANWGPYSCSATKQGTRPGRADTYGSGLTGQYIDLTGVPDGIYWLEGTVDPLGNVLELDETNNVTRVLVNIGAVPPATEDAYENNDTRAIVDGRTPGVNSPDLGLVNATRVIDNLSMNDNEDWYKFRLNKAGTPGDYIRIESPYHEGQNLFLYLVNSSGTVLSSQTGSYAVKSLSLNGRPAGTYYARVVRSSGANPRYMLTIDPAAQLPPSVTITSPPSGLTWVEKAYDTIPVRWLCNDPEGDPKTVSLLADRNPVVGSSNIQLTGFQDLNGSDLEANIITTNFDIGAWYIIARASDGGAQSHTISPGLAMIYVKGDVDWNGVCNEDDWMIFRKYEVNGKFDDDWTKILDFDRDGDFDSLDREEFFEHSQGG
jgi:hypothetical protein